MDDMDALMTPTETRPGTLFSSGAWRVTAFVAGAWLLAASAYAQIPTGTILGGVKDAQGAVVPGATVTATNTGTQFSRSATTDLEGQYQLALLPVGDYAVQISMSGFKTFARTGIALEVGRNARVDATIELGNFSEVVSIVGDAPLIETTSGALSRTVGQNEVLNLPLVNRDLYALLSLTGGVSSNDSSNSLGGPEQLTTINGSSRAQMGSVNFQLDGGNNTAGLRGTGNPAPNPEAVQEFRVLTNAYGAEYGRYAAGVVDVVTKSGTNQFHGAAFEFFRNEKLNAPRWAAPGTTSTKDPLDRNQFGGALGGPVKTDRTFFFGSYSGLRQQETYFRNNAVVPTALERAGDFSQSVRQPNDPATRAPFPGGVIPAARFDAAAKTIQDQYVPLSNLPNSFYEVRRPDPLNTDEATLKLDHSLSAGHTMALSYFFQTGTDTQPLSLSGNIPWVDRDFQWNQHNVNFADSWALSPSAINQFRVSYMRQFGGRVNNPTTSLADLGSKFSIQGDPTLPRLIVSGFFTGQTSIAGPDAGSDYFGVKDAVSLSRGRHAMKFGAEVSYEKIVHDTLLDNYGVFTFDGTKTGNAYADFLLGVPARMSQDAPIRKTDNGAYISLFAQDDFRVHSRVTLNLGVRYDVQFPYTDPQDRKLAFSPGSRSTVSPTAPEGLLFPGDQGVSRGIVKTDFNNVAPRLGVAWDPRGDGRTAIRGGFGIFYGSITGNEWNTTADNQPFTVRQSFPTVFTLSDPYRNLPGGVGPFPFNYTPGAPRFTLPAQVFGPSLDFEWPYTYQANVTLQKEIGRGMSASASYVGAFARHLAAPVDRNYPLIVPGATAANVNSRRPYLPGTIAAANVLESIFSSDYNGLQLSAERRGARLSAKAYYSLGKAVEDVDFQGGGLPTVQNSNRLELERGRASSDRRHSFVLSSVLKMDYFKDSTGLLSALLDDWTVSSIVTVTSGSALTINAGQDRNLDGINNDRADLVGEPGLDSGRSRDERLAAWFNIAAFASPASGTDGTGRRGVLSGPGFRNVDLGLFRDFGLPRRTKLQFRMEATNVFNIVNLSNPGTNSTPRRRLAGSAPPATCARSSWVRACRSETFEVGPVRAFAQTRKSKAAKL
ncbi:MAG TPA: carboxypeptidase regulatory-like domain-containing protein [Vicinamibacterales bacterium]|nr:carboxypeptidase regulatory-like domain-containing protein [Vicinamibacterales bacterium]